MTDIATTVELLFDKVEDYGSTTIKLIKLEAIRTTAELISSIVSKIIVIISVAMAVLIFNIGIALWLGKITGENYIGFFIITGFYLFSALLLFICRNIWIKRPLRNKLIIKMRREKLL